VLKFNFNQTPVSACALSITLGAMATALAAPYASAHGLETIVHQDGDNDASTQMVLMMVKADKTQLRCGDQDIFYAVAELSANTPLQTAGISGDYTKVLLPKSIGAYVPANEVEVSTDAKAVTLKVNSKLRAPSHLLGLSGSWKALFSEPVSAGSSLDVIEVLKNDSGDVLGYRVVAPKSSAGELATVYVRTDALRQATDQETAAFGSGSTLVASNTPTQPDVNESDSQVESQTDSKPPQTNEIDSSLMEEMDTPTSNQPAQSESDDSPVEITNAAPVPVQEPEPTTRRAPSGQLSVSQLEDLESAFDRARQLTKAQLDEALPELLAEFTRSRSSADDGTSLARALDQRIEWIQIRIESRDQRLAIARALAEYDARASQLASSIEAWQKGRAYQLVGRMVTSSVYNGENLPLLYRIQTTDPTTGSHRTVGYVAPRQDQDFRHMLGRIVGVVGTKSDDSSLHLSVVEPDRIDLMPEVTSDLSSE
jgi:hypothetical protein